MGFSLQANVKTKEGTEHPDRDAQFGYLNTLVKARLRDKQPVISVDTKKKELVGEFKTAGANCAPKATRWPSTCTTSSPTWVARTPTASTTWPPTAPGSPSAPTTTPRASPSRRSAAGGSRWAKPRHPAASELTITADCGGSNGYRTRLWKVELQDLADELQIPITVCHLPPGTSKWNRIEHRLFSHITMNWRGKPLISHEVIVSLIAATTTQTGLTVQAALDTDAYPKGIKITDEQMTRLTITRHDFHGDWNYTITPRRHCRDISLTGPKSLRQAHF